MNVEVVANAAPVDTVFVHGNMASNTWWQPTLEKWSTKGPGRLLLTEWRGCGKSAAPTSASQLHPSVLADDLLNALKELNVTIANVVAHSTGGIIAMHAMYKAPKLFHRAVMLDTVGANGVTFDESMYAVFDQMRADKTMCAMVLAGTIHNVDQTSPLFKQIVDDAFGIPEINWRGVLGNLRGLHFEKEAAQIQQPTLVLHGELDPVLTIADSRALAKLLPHGEFVELKGHGHSTNVEDPKLFHELTKNFLFDPAHVARN